MPSLDDLGLNRFVSKGNQSNTIKSASGMAVNSSTSTGDNFYDSNNFDTKDARQIQTGTVISNCFIRTTDLPARVELSGNDAVFYDDSTGGTSPVTGDSALIKFVRSDDTSKFFSITKRASVFDDLDNVMDFYYSEPASGNYNFIFFGRSGDSSDQQRNTGAIYNCANFKDSEPVFVGNGYYAIEVSIDEVPAEVFSVITGDSRGIAPLISTGGISTVLSAYDGGAVAMGYPVSPNFNFMWYINDATKINMGASIIPDAGTYDIGLIVGTVNRVQNIYFNGQVAGPDIACNTFNNFVKAGSSVLAASLNCGSFVNTVKSTFLGGVVACPLPTVSNALDIIRRIPEPTKVGDRGHYGDKLYFDDLTFPEEVLWEIDGVKEIEHTHMIGLLMKAVVELTKEVDYLKAQLNK